MSNLEKLGAAAIEALELQDSLDAAYDAINNYTKTPNPETAGKLIGVLSSQLADQLAAQFIDKLLPDKGEKFLWETLKGQFDNPRSMESDRQKTKLLKVSMGAFIGYYIENK